MNHARTREWTLCQTKTIIFTIYDQYSLYAHRMNLAFKIVIKFPLVSKVEELVHETHAYFCRSPKRPTKIQQFVDGVMDGKNI